MGIRDDLSTLGIQSTDPKAVLAYVAKLPVLRTERIRLLRQYEQEEGRPFPTLDFARAVEGVSPL